MDYILPSPSRLFNFKGRYFSLECLGEFPFFNTFSCPFGNSGRQTKLVKVVDSLAFSSCFAPSGDASNVQNSVLVPLDYYLYSGSAPPLELILGTRHVSSGEFLPGFLVEPIPLNIVNSHDYCFSNASSFSYVFRSSRAHFSTSQCGEVSLFFLPITSHNSDITIDLKVKIANDKSSDIITNFALDPRCGLCMDVPRDSGLLKFSSSYPFIMTFEVHCSATTFSMEHSLPPFYFHGDPLCRAFYKRTVF